MCVLIIQKAEKRVKREAWKKTGSRSTKRQASRQVMLGKGDTITM